MRNFSKYPLLVMVLVMVAAVTAACGGGGDTPSGASNTPEQAVKSFLEAAFAGNTDALNANLCAAEQTNSEQAAQAFASMAASGATINIESATYTTSNQTDTSATVTVGGSGTVTVQGQAAPFPLDGAFPPFTVANESGAWKVCGLTS